jgi:hypothetical protein
MENLFHRLTASLAARARRPPPHRLFLARCLFPAACCLWLGAFSARAGEILGGRFYTAPEKVYVNQAFEIHFDLETTFGTEVEDLRISDFPNNPDIITVERLESMKDSRVTRDNQTITVRHLAAKARAHRPFDRTFSPTLQCMLVERRNAGFFSHWQSFPKQKQLSPFRLNIQPLPEAGRPETFSGAIGIFRLGGRLSQTAVQPGDIVTLALDLNGQGWLGDHAAMPPLPASPLFKTYPPKELLREAAHLKTEQVFIPQNTNATEIAAVRFTFFNPATEKYEESVAGPFRLTFSDAPSVSKPEEVRVIDTARPASADLPSKAVILQQMNQTLRHAVPLLAGCAGALAAFFVFFLLVGTRKRLAVIAGALVLAGGVGAGYLLNDRTASSARQLIHRTDVVFAPSRAAATLFSLNPGTPVVPLENCGAWVRIDASGRRGWIRAEAFAE